MTGKRLTHDLIICTRNRPQDLEVALATVGHQTRRPDRVIVVDSSDDSQSREVLSRWTERRPDLTAVWLKAEPGLPHQRNVGAQASSAEVVHYIDDDVELSASYLDVLMNVFESQDEVIGAGGLITNPPPRHPRLWWRLAVMDSKRQGVVLASGVNVIVHDVSRPTGVQWLSGCSMSYRRELVLRLRFDEALPGYALMEDADFGYRAGKLGSLLVHPDATLRHNVSPAGRWLPEARERAATYRRAWFVRKNMPWWHVFVLGYSVLAGALVQVVVSLFTLRRNGVKVAWWRLLGAVDYWRGAR